MKDAELNESLLKKIGFTIVDKGKYKVVSSPDGKVYGSSGPDLVHDLSACFKWLVPELRKQGLIKIIVDYYANGDVGITLDSFLIVERAQADTESKALCLAADKFLR